MKFRQKEFTPKVTAKMINGEWTVDIDNCRVIIPKAVIEKLFPLSDVFDEVQLPQKVVDDLKEAVLKLNKHYGA